MNDQQQYVKIGENGMGEVKPIDFASLAEEEKILKTQIAVSQARLDEIDGIMAKAAELGVDTGIMQ